MAVDVGAVCEQIAGLLRTAGVRANVDPTKLTPPCAWIQPTQIEHTRLCGGGVVTVVVWLVSPDRPPAQAHTILGGLLDTALAVIDPTEATTTADSLTLTNSGQPLPAYRITTTIEA